MRQHSALLSHSLSVTTQLRTALWAPECMGYEPHSEIVVVASEAGMAGAGQRDSRISG